MHTLSDIQRFAEALQMFAGYGRIGGSSKSERKRTAVRRNGKKGGRPKKTKGP